MQAQIEAQSAVLKQSATEADKLQAQAQLVDQQQMLKRVSEIKASGRISLDLDPEKPVLPALTLTDGDSVFIPTRPGMVGVFGEFTFRIDDFVRRRREQLSRNQHAG
jgi:hypothetical protein